MYFMKKTRNAFTLVEMLVVIGILALLIAVLMGVMGGSTESARAASCFANLKSLANACHSAAVASANPQAYPTAGSEVTYKITFEGNSTVAKANYIERKGWISWKSMNVYPSSSPQACDPISMFTENSEDAHYALTNGALWKYVAANSRVYVCPSHTKKANPVHWSYLMNATFGWNGGSDNFFDSEAGFVYYGGKISCKRPGDRKIRERGPDRVLLFGEVPFTGPGNWFPSGSGGTTDTDAILQFEGCDENPNAPSEGAEGKENIGANHKNGKYWCAHVVFADGHTEKISVGKTDGAQMDATTLKKLTTYLCTGTDYSLHGTTIEVLDQ